jgi:hypothetical protein
MALPLMAIRDTLWFKRSQVVDHTQRVARTKTEAPRSVLRALAVKLETYLSLFAG